MHSKLIIRLSRCRVASRHWSGTEPGVGIFPRALALSAAIEASSTACHSGGGTARRGASASAHRLPPEPEESHEPGVAASGAVPLSAPSSLSVRLGVLSLLRLRSLRSRRRLSPLPPQEQGRPPRSVMIPWRPSTRQGRRITCHATATCSWTAAAAPCPCFWSGPTGGCGGPCPCPLLSAYPSPCTKTWGAIGQWRVEARPGTCFPPS